MRGEEEVGMYVGRVKWVSMWGGRRKKWEGMGGKGDALLGVVYIYCTVRERTGSRV